MKDLALLYNGGHPLRIDDINHMQSGINQVLSELAKTFTRGQTKAILIGCKISELTGPDRTVNEAGLIVIDGEIFYLPAETQAGHLVTPQYQVVESFAAPSPVTYEDLNDRNVHRVREIRVATAAAPAPNLVVGYNVSSFVRIKDNWITPVLSSTWLEKDQNGEGLDVQYTVDYFSNKVELRGCCHFTSTPATSKLFTLPAGKRPSAPVMRTIHVGNHITGVGYAPTMCIIETNGDVSVDVGAGGLSAHHLDGVYFYL